MTDRPRIVLFTGEGKGKTTAALGMALRATGHGMRVLVVQFVKQDPDTGELAAARHLDHLDIVQTGCGFLPKPDDPQFAEHAEAARAGLEKAQKALTAGNYAMIVLDEICFAVARGLIDEKDVLQLIDRAPDGMLLALTGRNATPGLIARADTVSEIRCIKHAMKEGRPAQKGIEL